MFLHFQCHYKIRFICQAKSVRCSYPSVLPEHAQLVTDIAGSEFFALKQMIQFKCQDNRVLVGNRTITCENDGFFTAPEFSCENRTVLNYFSMFFISQKTSPIKVFQYRKRRIPNRICSILQVCKPNVTTNR